MSLLTIFCDCWDGGEIATGGVPDASCLEGLDVLGQMERLFITAGRKISWLSGAFPIDGTRRVKGIDRLFAGETVIAKGYEDLSGSAIGIFGAKMVLAKMFEASRFAI